MPLSPFPITGKICASDGSTGFPDVEVILRNTSRDLESSANTSGDGSFSFDLANIGGYVSGDSLRIDARIGNFWVYTTGTVSGDGWNAGNLTLSSTDDLPRIYFPLIKEELIVFIRNKINDPNNRLSTKIDVFKGDGHTLRFNLSVTNGKSVEYVLVDGIIKTRYTDYYVDYKDKNVLSNPVVYFLTPPLNDSVIEVKYRYGDTDWVYGDYPFITTTVDDYPRIKMDISSLTTNEFAFGGGANYSNGVVEAIVWDDKASVIDDLVDKIRRKIIDSKKDFHFLDFITPSEIGRLTPTPERGDKIIQRESTYLVRSKVEVI